MGCFFCKIAAGEIPATLLFNNEQLVAFSDIKPKAPTHILIVPKKHIATIDDTDPLDECLLGQMVLAAKTIAHTKSLDGYRLIFNVNELGGQTVEHIHLHLLGGRQMTWPPG